MLFFFHSFVAVLSVCLICADLCVSHAFLAIFSPDSHNVMYIDLYFSSQTFGTSVPNLVIDFLFRAFFRTQRFIQAVSYIPRVLVECDRDP